jgi:hypothetical protein
VEPEVDAADEPLLSPVLDRVDRLAFHLAEVGADRLAEAAVVVGLDLRRRCGLEELARPREVRRREREIDAAPVIVVTFSAGTYFGLPSAEAATARPSKMSALLSPATSSTWPTSVPSAA